MEALSVDEVVKAGLGAIADEFIDLKTKEWEPYDAQVTVWEIDRYLMGRTMLP